VRRRICEGPANSILGTDHLLDAVQWRDFLLAVNNSLGELFQALRDFGG